MSIDFIMVSAIFFDPPLLVAKLIASGSITGLVGWPERWTSAKAIRISRQMGQRIEECWLLWSREVLI